MNDLIKKELEEEGKKILGGVLILLWVAGVITWLGLMSFNTFNFIPDWFPGFHAFSKAADSSNIFSIAIPGLYVAALVGLYIRKGWAVPVTRAAIVVTMVVFFPIGTIFGAIVWKRINDKIAKKYLNYGMNKENDTEDDKNTPEVKDDSTLQS
ncbi:MAG: hypothetical protein M1479_08475 [Actinobacteria bacterium]|nr:hypothetical protein [Cyanobacteriota bacterium]MCL5772293.1 hypothetical protein [Actinomycetota bacterium]